MKTIPTPPLPPTTPGNTLVPNPPQPPSPVEILALLISDGIVEPQEKHFNFYLSNKELIVNSQPQSVELLAKYHQYFGLTDTASSDILSVQVG